MSHGDLAGLRLLVVEDDAMVRDVIVRTARERGIEVDEADGGGPATTLLESNRYDVVITDFKMPGVSGLAVMNSVRAAHPGTALIVITGFAEGDLDERVTSAGGLLLHKPFNVDGLLEALAWAKERVVGPQSST